MGRCILPISFKEYNYARIIKQNSDLYRFRHQTYDEDLQ